MPLYRAPTDGVPIGTVVKSSQDLTSEGYLQMNGETYPFGEYPRLEEVWPYQSSGAGEVMSGAFLNTGPGSTTGHNAITATSGDGSLIGFLNLSDDSLQMQSPQQGTGVGYLNISGFTNGTPLGLCESKTDPSKLYLTTDNGVFEIDSDFNDVAIAITPLPNTPHIIVDAIDRLIIIGAGVGTSTTIYSSGASNYSSWSSETVSLLTGDTYGVSSACWFLDGVGNKLVIGIDTDVSLTNEQVSVFESRDLANYSPLGGLSGGSINPSQAHIVACSPGSTMVVVARDNVLVAGAGSDTLYPSPIGFDQGPTIVGASALRYRPDEFVFVDDFGTLLYVTKNVSAFQGFGFEFSWDSPQNWSGIANRSPQVATYGSGNLKMALSAESTNIFNLDIQPPGDAGLLVPFISFNDLPEITYYVKARS